MGKTISSVYFETGPNTAAGSWRALYGNLVLESADGAVHPIYTRENSVWLGVNAPTQMTGSYGIDQYVICVTCSGDVTTYYHDDQIGSSRIMTGVGGWPIWQGTFLPYGEEYNPQITTNHFKFTGKERDTETNLDYFGARYYSNGLGRFITPDWAAKATAVPYAEFADPQSLNLYTYVRNVPTTRYDADGHCSGQDCTNVKVTAEVDQKPKFQKNVEIKDINGKVVAKATGVQGQLIDTVKVNGKSQPDVKVTEKNQETHTVNGKEIANKLVEGKGSSNELGQIGDKIGTFNQTSGSKEDNNAIVKQLSTDAHTITDKQTLTLTLPSGTTCEATSTRILTNVGPDGNGSAHYTLTTTQPVVTKPD